MKYHIIYKTTNLINGKWYIGKHSTDNLNDGYLGSSQHLKSAIKKYGKHNFVREILVFCNSEQEAYEKEAEMVTMEIVKNPMTYNKMLGGEGSNRRFTDQELKEHERKWREDNREHIRERKRKWYQANKEHELEYNQTNKERIRERKRDYYKANREQLLEYQQEYYKANRERKLEYGREYRQANKERIREYKREYKREYYQANKERELEYKLVKMVKLARQKYLSK